MDRKQISEIGSTERSEGSGEREGEQKKAKRFDVSVPQVAGSALAAVIAAVVAGKLGVYGTFIGAGVVSAVATTGGPLFQHLFHRTGEQVKEVKGVKGAGTSALPATSAAGPGDTDRTQLLPQAAPESGEFGAATTHGTTWRGWKRTLLPAVLVFAVAIGGLTLYEAVSGTNVSGGRAGTSIGEVFHHNSSDEDSPSAPEQPTDGDDGTDSTDGTGGTGDGSTGGDQQDPSTDPTPDQGGSGGQHGGTGTDGGTGGSTPTPTPSPDGSGGGEAGGADSGGDTAGIRGTDGGADTSGEGAQRSDPDAAQ